ncbi:ABC transporter ATP-binding protein [Paenibacillus swuensis]|uniref:ABC transporter ATP-binding protein n=1 Tax=Paenibacillus swuensis TaxID=1178515 RepID=A0A172TPN0_9BACL|nr:ABC transporter ATP-binding protein [Paenibacillus swuensis]
MEVRNVVKRIGGKTIIKGISFDVREGEIFGFLGPNGSGKTTTIRMLVDLIKPSEGEVYICGHDVQKEPEKALTHVGCIVENPEMYPYLTGWENLAHFADMQPGISQARIQEVVDIVGMDQRIHDKVKTYSLGMRQRLGIAQALLGRPKLLILDEPTNGLDPKGIKELRQFIRKLADEGMSLFISSHLLSEIQLMCDRVAIISKGEVIAVGEVETLIQGAETYVVWDIDPAGEGRYILEQTPGVQFVPDHHPMMDEAVLAGKQGMITQMNPELIPEINDALVKSGIRVGSIQLIHPSLEELFLQLTESEGIA